MILFFQEPFTLITVNARQFLNNILARKDVATK